MTVLVTPPVVVLVEVAVVELVGELVGDWVAPGTAGSATVRVTVLGATPSAVTVIEYRDDDGVTGGAVSHFCRD